MKTFIQIIIFLTIFNSCAQNKEIDTIKPKKIPMSETVQRRDSQSTYRYYEKGSKVPFTGILYGKYDNGNFLTTQEYRDGLGNGYWIDYDPEGQMECKGTYINNRVEGPVSFYYENGKVKSTGQYLHWKKKIGEWIYYDKKGNMVLRINYTF